MAIFCQNCYDATHDVTKSVHSLNTSGRCSKCDSEAVLDAALMTAVLAGQATKVVVKSIIDETPYRREPRRIQSNTDFIRTEDIREFLKANGFASMEASWDGTYFEHHLWFLVEPGYQPNFTIMVENRDGSQKEAKFRMTWEVL